MMLKKMFTFVMLAFVQQPPVHSQSATPILTTNDQGFLTPAAVDQVYEAYFSAAAPFELTGLNTINYKEKIQSINPSTSVGQVQLLTFLIPAISIKEDEATHQLKGYLTDIPMNMITEIFSKAEAGNDAKMLAKDFIIPALIYHQAYIYFGNRKEDMTGTGSETIIKHETYDDIVNKGYKQLKPIITYLLTLAPSGTVVDDGVKEAMAIINNISDLPTTSYLHGDRTPPKITNPNFDYTKFKTYQPFILTEVEQNLFKTAVNQTISKSLPGFLTFFTQDYVDGTATPFLPDNFYSDDDACQIIMAIKAAEFIMSSTISDGKNLQPIFDLSKKEGNPDIVVPNFDTNFIQNDVLNKLMQRVAKNKPTISMASINKMLNVKGQVSSVQTDSNAAGFSLTEDELKKLAEAANTKVDSNKVPNYFRFFTQSYVEGKTQPALPHSFENDLEACQLAMAIKAADFRLNGTLLKPIYVNGQNTVSADNSSANPIYDITKIKETTLQALMNRIDSKKTSIKLVVLQKFGVTEYRPDANYPAALDAAAGQVPADAVANAAYPEGLVKPVIHPPKLGGVDIKDDWALTTAELAVFKDAASKDRPANMPSFLTFFTKEYVDNTVNPCLPYNYYDPNDALEIAKAIKAADFMLNKTEGFAEILSSAGLEKIDNAAEIEAFDPNVTENKAKVLTIIGDKGVGILNLQVELIKDPTLKALMDKISKLEALVKFKDAMGIGNKVQEGDVIGAAKDGLGMMGLLPENIALEAPTFEQPKLTKVDLAFLKTKYPVDGPLVSFIVGLKENDVVDFVPADMPVIGDKKMTYDDIVHDVVAKALPKSGNAHKLKAALSAIKTTTAEEKKAYDVVADKVNTAVIGKNFAVLFGKVLATLNSPGSKSILSTIQKVQGPDKVDLDKDLVLDGFDSLAPFFVENRPIFEQMCWDFLCLAQGAFKQQYLGAATLYKNLRNEQQVAYKEATKWSLTPEIEAQLKDVKVADLAPRLGLNQADLTAKHLAAETKVIDMLGSLDVFNTLFSSLVHRSVFNQDPSSKLFDNEFLANIQPFEVAIAADITKTKAFVDMNKTNKKEYLTQALTDNPYLTSLRSGSLAFKSAPYTDDQAAIIMATYDAIPLFNTEEKILEFTFLKQTLKFNPNASMDVYISQKIGQKIFKVANGVGPKRENISGLEITDLVKFKQKFTDFLAKILRARYGVNGPTKADVELMKADLPVSARRLERIILSWFNRSEQVLTDQEIEAMKSVIPQPRADALPPPVVPKAAETVFTDKTAVDTLDLKTVASFDDANEAAGSEKLVAALKAKNMTVIGVKSEPDTKEIQISLSNELKMLSNNQVTDPTVGLGKGLAPLSDKLKIAYPDYRFSWLIVSSIEQDETAAANRCVDKLAANQNLLPILQTEKPYYAVKMVTRIAKRVNANTNEVMATRKKHYCGMIFSRPIE